MVVAAEFREGLCHVRALCERTTGLSEFVEQKAAGDAFGSCVGVALALLRGRLASAFRKRVVSVFCNQSGPQIYL